MLGAPLVIESRSGQRRSALVLNNLSGERAGDSLTVRNWGGSLLLGE
jgi:hypothetical protein